MTNLLRSSTSLNDDAKIALLARVELERRRRARGQLSFRGAAAQAQTITASEWIISGPAETGKTYASMYRLHQELSKTPNARATIVRKIRASLVGTALETWHRVIEVSGTKPRKYGGEQSWLYVYPNGAKCYVGGLDNADKILSSERDFVYINQAEELTAHDWETLTTRTTGRGAVTKTPMLFGDCNPSDPEHWILEREKSGNLVLLRSRHIDNPTLHDGTDWTEQGLRSIGKLQALTGPRYARLYLGEWVRDDGEEAFLPSMSMFDSCTKSIPPLTDSQPMVIALDAALSGDTFALVGVTRDPESSEQIIIRLSKVWVPSGEPLDFLKIEEEIRAIIDRYNVIQVCYDPYQMHYFSQRLQDAVWVDSFNQGNDRLEADAGLRALFIQRNIFHDGSHQILRDHIANADAKMDGTGNRLRLVKRSSHLKIDAAVALSMACHRAVELNLY